MNTYALVFNLITYISIMLVACIWTVYNNIKEYTLASALRFFICV